MISAKAVTSLEKVIATQEPDCRQITDLSRLKNEKLNFQIIFMSDIDTDIKAEINSDLSYNIYSVNDVPVTLAAFDYADDYVISKQSGMYPDYLVPFKGTIKADKSKWYSLWVEITETEKCGNFPFTIKINDAVIKVDIDIINADLPKQEIIYTNWYHADCICDYYNVKQMSDEFWRINYNFIKTAAEHGQNCILTPLFTPPLDTAVGGERTTVQLVRVRKRGKKYLFDFRNLKKWTDMCRSLGIEYFEMSHMFTQWGAKHSPKIIVIDKKGREKKAFGWFTRTYSKDYEDFIKQFGKAIDKFIEKENLSNNVFFHISDEPDVRHLAVYKKRAKLIMEVFGKYPVLDALSDYDFYKAGSVTIPVPNENSIENFVGKVDNLWTYYCCCQCYENEPNRFITMPSLRNRVIGVLAYKYQLKGFLHWGYNFYNSQYSLEHIDPYKVTDAGGKFPSGDAFVVYPAKDGTTYCSLRLKVFYDAFQDLRALNLLESKIGRDNVLKMIGDISFTDYPHDEKWLLGLREAVNNRIKSSD